MIIRIPQPDTEFRLTLVRVNDPHLKGERNATPKDLARAGYVPLAAFVGPLDLLCPPTLAGALEAIAGMRMSVTPAHAEALARAEKAERERDEAIERADRAETEAALFLEDRETAERTLALHGERLREVERERDEAEAALVEERAGSSYGAALGAELRAAMLKAEGLLIQRETELRLAREDAAAVARALGTVHAEARRLAAELARLTATAEGEHVRTEPRATDQELFDLGERVRLDTPADPAMSNPEEGLRCAAYLAVAERVRRERCLVTRAVEANVDIRVCEDDGGGFMVGVHAPDCDEDLERNVPAADVPATLARLLGEVARG